MAQVLETIDVDVPVDTAYNQWTQFESFPRFMSGVDSATQVDDTHVRWKVTVGGVSREFLTEITEQHPDERVGWKSVEGPDHAGVITFQPLGENTSRVTAKIDWEPEGIVEHAGALVGADEARVKADLARFKDFIEARGAETGRWRGEVDETRRRSVG